MNSKRNINVQYSIQQGFSQTNTMIGAIRDARLAFSGKISEIFPRFKLFGLKNFVGGFWPF